MEVLQWNLMMKKETRVALEGSIEKWEGIVAGTKLDAGIRNCPLCQLFYSKKCFGCPIAKKSGCQECDNTPYDEFRYKESKENAQKELNFLRLLRPGKRSMKKKYVAF